jgi:putative transposase
MGARPQRALTGTAAPRISVRIAGSRLPWAASDADGGVTYSPAISGPIPKRTVSNCCTSACAKCVREAERAHGFGQNCGHASSSERWLKARIANSPVLRKYYIRSRREGAQQVTVWQSRLIKSATHTGTMSRRRRSWPSTIRRLLCDVVTLARLALTPRAQLAAENLFLRKQLALYQERCVKPRRPDPATRVILVLLSGLLDWRSILTVVKPDTLIRWHRQGWRLFWRWKSRPGRPPIPRNLQRLIVRMAQANPTWGEERIAHELRLKLGLTVSPRTVGRYLRTLEPRRGGQRSQRWATFVRNHAHAVLACDFFTTVTVPFRNLYVFVVLEVGTRRILHWNVTEHPTAEWTVQQFRAVITPETSHRFVLHDRDSIYAATVDRAIASMGRHVLKTPCGHRRPTRSASD